MKIVWTKSAVINLGNLKNYVAQDSEFYATELVTKIIDAIEKLDQFPRLGREVPEIKRDDIREIIYNNYRIIYKVERETLFVLAVIHAARDIYNIKPNPWEII